MDVQVDLAKVLEITEARLAQANRETAILECVVNQQREELGALKVLLETLSAKEKGDSYDEG
jgi:hypothetical protein